MNMKIIAALPALLVVAVAVCFFCFRSQDELLDTELDGKQAEEKRPETPRKHRKEVVPSKPKAKAERPARVKTERKKKPRTHVSNWTPEETRLHDAVQTALDSQNFQDVRKSAQEALASDNEEIRQAAVDALGWFGEVALLDLSKALADKSENVAESARLHIERTLMGMPNQVVAFDLAAMILENLADNTNAIVMLSGIMSSAGTSFVEPDRPDSEESVMAAIVNRRIVVEKIENLIAKGGRAGAAADEIYKTISGENWSGHEAAMKWADDIPRPEIKADDLGDETQETVEPPEIDDLLDSTDSPRMN